MMFYAVINQAAVYSLGQNVDYPCNPCTQRITDQFLKGISGGIGEEQGTWIFAILGVGEVGLPFVCLLFSMKSIS